MSKETKEDTKKSKSTIKVVLVTIIICALVCIPLGIFISPYLLDTTTPLPKADETETGLPQEETEIDITSDKASQAMDSYNKIYISPAVLYNGENYSIKNISNYDLIASGLKLIDKSYVTFCTSEPLTKDVPLTYINGLLKDYIENKPITAEKIKTLTKETSYYIADYEVIDYGVKLVDDNNIRIAGPCGHIGFYDYENRHITKATETTDYIYIYEKIAYASYAEESENMVNYYKTYDKAGVIIETIPSSQITDNNGNPLNGSEPNWSLYNTYKYTFKKHSNGYYFKEFELVK